MSSPSQQIVINIPSPGDTPGNSISSPQIGTSYVQDSRGRGLVDRFGNTLADPGDVAMLLGSELDAMGDSSSRFGNSAGKLDGNVIADSKALGDLALELFRIPFPAAQSAAQMCLQKAVSLGDQGEMIGLEWPGLQRIGGQPLDLRQPLVKSLAANVLNPSGTPHRLNETMYALGAYDGVQSPESATNMTFHYLKRVARMPIVDTLISLRVLKATRFAKNPRFTGDTGFEIRRKSSGKAKGKVTRLERKRIEELTDLMMHCGVSRDARGKVRRHPLTGEPGVWDGFNEEKAPTFSEFISQVTRDSWVMDWACVRTEPSAYDPDAYPILFFAPVAAEMVRRTWPDKYEPKILTGESIKYVELPAECSGWGGDVVREFTWDRMFTMVRKPRTDVFGKGYGLSETEIAIDVIAALSLGFDFQKDYFDSNHIPVGLLTMTGFASSSATQTLQRIKAEAIRNSGPKNFWRIMCLALNPGGTIDFKPLRSASGGVGEMQFVKEYMVMLVNILAAVYQANAEEIGWESVASKGSSIGGEDPLTKIQHSEDKGFKPYMECLAASLNANIIERYDPDYELAWIGIDSHNTESEQKTMRAWMEMGASLADVNEQMDEVPDRKPIFPILYEKAAADYDEDDDDYEEQVAEAYEKEFRKLVPSEAVSPWADYMYAPTMNQSAFQSWQQQQAQAFQVMQAVEQQKAAEEQQAAMEAQGGQQAMGPDGQPYDPNDPFGHGAPADGEQMPMDSDEQMQGNNPRNARAGGAQNNVERGQGVPDGLTKSLVNSLGVSALADDNAAVDGEILVDIIVGDA